ncbi:MAG: Gfo/Idh/MocA family oxidoreductase [Planctomycetes bacterium]|nr:Gfo/Idh/MocA family oxidoreductase [Planctomycetota bacterium]
MPLRVAVVGVGHLGKIHADIYAKLAKKDPQFELAALCDVTPEAEQAAKALKVPYVPDYTKLEGKVDAVSVVVPTTYHRKVGGFFLERGVSCLVEKPIAKTAAEAEELCALAAKSGAILQVGHVERFNPVVRAAGPYLGRPRFIEATRISPYPFRSTDVGVTLDLMIHDIDLAVALAGEEPAEIRAAGTPVFSKSEDVANARLEFPGGCVANVTASCVSLKKERKWRIFQDNGYLSLNLLDNEGVFIEKSEALKRGEIDPSKLSLASLGVAALTFQLEKLIKRVSLKGDKTPPLDAELAAFVACVRERRTPLVDGPAGLRALKVAERVLACMKAL